jgi:hypothetical protein
MLCALAISAFAAQSAAATTKGTTAFTCKEVAAGTGTFKKAHCKAADAGTGNFSHVQVAENTATTIRGTNENTGPETGSTPTISLKNTIGGVEYEIQVALVQGEGTLTNAKDPETGEHYVHGQGNLVFSGAAVTKPSGKGCKPYTDTESKTKGAEGVIDASFKATTKGQGDFVKFEPLVAGTFATYFVECTTKVPAMEGTWEVGGSLKCPLDGATVVCKHAEVTEQNTLKGKGVKTGIEGSLTLSGKDPVAGEEVFTPLSVTTVETP